MIRSLRMQPNRKLYFKELPMPPTPGPGEVQVRMAFASICGYDMMMLRGTAAYPLNGYLGHEGSGVVTAVGENVRALHPGDRVTINPYEPCGLCDACRSNRPEYCTNPSSGYANLMTEYLNIRQQQVFRLPEQVSLRAGSLIEPMSCAFCADCTRIRITADGKLKPCLHSDAELALRGLSGAELEAAIRQGILMKPARHRMDETGVTETHRGMFAIGG